MRAHRAIVLVMSGALLAGCDPTSPPSTATPVAPTPAVAPTDNGVSALPAEEVLLRATSALRSRSFHVKGDFVRAGEVLLIDLHIEGTSGRGTVVTTGEDGAAHEGWTLEILRVGDAAYVKMPAIYLPDFAEALIWPQHAPMPGAPALPAIDQLVAHLTGRYIKMPSGIGPLARVFDPEAGQVIDPARQLLQVIGPVTKGATTTVNGVPVIAITDQATADWCLDVGAQCDGRTIYVGTTGEPYPIRIETGDRHIPLDFADFGAPVELVPPAPLDIFDATPYLQPH